MSGILQLIPNTEREKYNQMPVRIHAHRLFTYDPENNRHCLLFFGYRCVKQIIQTPSGKCNPLSLHARK